MVSANIKAFLIEGIIIGILISSMTTATTYISESLTGDREDRRVHWVANLTMAIIGHMIAESFRHDRLVDILKGAPKFVPVSQPIQRRLATRNLSIDDIKFS